MSTAERLTVACDDCYHATEFEEQEPIPGSPFCEDHIAARATLADDGYPVEDCILPTATADERARIVRIWERAR